jgi:hypothetical protein
LDKECRRNDGGCSLDVTGIGPVAVGGESGCFDGLVTTLIGNDVNKLRAGIVRFSTAVLKSIGAPDTEIAQLAKLADNETAPVDKTSISNQAWRLPGVSCCFIATSARSRVTPPDAMIILSIYTH